MGARGLAGPVGSGVHRAFGSRGADQRADRQHARHQQSHREEVVQPVCRAGYGRAPGRAAAGPRPRCINDDAVAEVVRKTLEEKPRDATHWSTRSMARETGYAPSTIHRIWQVFCRVTDPHWAPAVTLQPRGGCGVGGGQRRQPSGHGQWACRGMWTCPVSVDT